MRVEPYEVGSHLHVIKRGARGMKIVHDRSDRQRFLRALYFMNDEYFDGNWMIVTKGKGLFYRPNHWPERKPLVNVLAYTLMPNHFHLLLHETQEDGTTRFMKKLAQSMAVHANRKYKESGSLFQGAYKSKTVSTDAYLRYVSLYIMVKNTLELYPGGGITSAIKDFAVAWGWALEYEFSSLGEYEGRRSLPILAERSLVKSYIQSLKNLRSECRDFLSSGKWDDKILE